MIRSQFGNFCTSDRATPYAETPLLCRPCRFLWDIYNVVSGTDIIHGAVAAITLVNNEIFLSNEIVSLSQRVCNLIAISS